MGASPDPGSLDNFWSGPARQRLNGLRGQPETAKKHSRTVKRKISKFNTGKSFCGKAFSIILHLSLVYLPSFVGSLIRYLYIYAYIYKFKPLQGSFLTNQCNVGSIFSSLT